MKKNNGIFDKCSSWEDFKNHIKVLNNKQKGDYFEALVKYYLLLSPIYATKLKSVWHLNEVPFGPRKYLNLPGPDEGIDLIAETKDGEFWAIQCKYREEETKSLTRKELSTFTDLALNLCKHVSLALVCTTADRFSYKLKIYGEKLSFCTGEVWRSLDKEFFHRLHLLLLQKSAPLKPFKPRPHQHRAILNAYRYYFDEKNDRGKLIMPCGTGKSLAAYWIAERLNAETILVAVPSLALIKQSLNVWARESVANNKDVNWICVCSDKTVAEEYKDDVAVLTQDLGILVHTNPDEISKWLMTPKKGTMVVFSTYQSGKMIAEATKKAGIVFDVGIMDEAHKTVGRKDSLFGYLLYDENIQIKKRIFMTATERQYRGESENIASMDDLKFYGSIFELLTFKEALNCKPKILSDYKIVTVAVAEAEISKLIEENVLVHPDKGIWDNEVEAEMLAAAIALRKVMKRRPIKHAVSFHHSIMRARAFKAIQDRLSSIFPEYGKLDTFHVSGTTPTAVRSRELEEFAASKKSLITNARCLTEGVDVPDIDCVLFADPKKSIIDTVQAVGRALRPAKGKRFSYVVVPVLISKEIESHEIDQAEAFDVVLTTLRALAANDERIIEYFRTISQGRKLSSRNKLVNFDFPDGLDIEIDSFVKSVELNFWSRLAKLSWRPFEQAREFIRSLGLKSREDWGKYCEGELPEKGTKPDDVPNTPSEVYRKKGWLNWGDWLGTGTIAPRLRKYLSFEEARQFTRCLELKSEKEWRRFCKSLFLEKGRLPDDIPANPNQTYKTRGWKGMGDWLGTGFIANQMRRYRSFEEAREYVRSLGLSGQKEWYRFCGGQLPKKGMLPEDVPANPNQTYKTRGWKGMGDWLGTGFIANQMRRYRSFEEAREYVRSLGLRNTNEWDAFCKGLLSQKGTLPEDIPANPMQTYKAKGWKGMGDWLGTGIIATFQRRYRSFEEARNFSRSLKLKSENEWRRFCRGLLPEKGGLPDDIPASPMKTYETKGWKGMGDWLGTGTIAPRLRQYLSFEDAREFARSLGLKSSNEWQEFSKGNLRKKETLPEKIPASPNQTYKNKGWKNWGDWLGTGTIAPRLRQYRSFKEARGFARSLGLKSGTEWRKFCKGQMPEKGALPADIPVKPDNSYTYQGWKGMGDWLGTGTIAPRLRQYLSFEDAREFARSLGLKSTNEWQEFSKGHLRKKETLPEKIPASPNQIYKNKGWKNWGDWLGTGTIAPRLRQYRSFKEARGFARSLGLKNQKGWRRFCRGQLIEKGVLPDDIPASPMKTYKTKGWKGMGDWLGTGTIAPRFRQYRSFEDAREFARSLGLKSADEWRKFCKGQFPEKGTLPKDISSNPNSTYNRKGWRDWYDWLRK